MSERSPAQREMIEVISSVDESWPLTLLYVTPQGADIKIQAGRSPNREEQQLMLAAMYLLFLEAQMNGDLADVADELVRVAEDLRDDQDVFELQWGGSLDEPPDSS